MTQIPVQLSDQSYWKDQIKCQVACPVNTDARGYVRAIADQDEELAYLIARGPNPLASICGWVCGAPCEQACRRGDYDKPIAIRALKRYVCGLYGPEARSLDGDSLIDFLTKAAQRHPKRQCVGREDLLSLLQSLTQKEIPKVQNKSVGIIGSGPAGLAAAHDLALLGFAVTIYEMENILAGMLFLGIPEYRLPRNLIQAEIDVITSMGVNAVTNCCIGKDITLPELRKKHDAIIIAVGAKISRQLPISGINAKGVLGGVEFLRDVALGNPPDLGHNVVVIGGGNVAYDVGRTLLRQESLDAARTAIRRPDVRDVYLCSLESLDEMPADDVEIIEGDEEGIKRKNALAPKQILTNDKGEVRAVQFQKCLRVFDENHRFNPVFDETDITEIECDHVLVAIGQACDISFVDAERDQINMLPNGMIQCDPDTGVTSATDLFVAGDLAYGPKLLIHAVASGKSVARAIYQQTTGNTLHPHDTELHFPVPNYDREIDYEKIARITPDTIDVTSRLLDQSKIVEKGFTPEQAQREASRCLNCGVNTIFDGLRCILCGGCVEVCPESCLKIIPLTDIENTPQSSVAIDEQMGSLPHSDASAILKDETTCIRCALCADRCPTGAITMEEFHFKESLTCPAV